MVRRMPSSATAPQRVRSRFRAKARQFDDLYEDERALVRLLRPGLYRRRELAIDTVRSYQSPAVLDVGCGSGRIGELALEAGASRYVGIDFSEPMIELARARLERFGDRVELVTENFLAASLDGPFRPARRAGIAGTAQADLHPVEARRPGSKDHVRREKLGAGQRRRRRGGARRRERVPGNQPAERGLRDRGLPGLARDRRTAVKP